MDTPFRDYNTSMSIFDDISHAIRTLQVTETKVSLVKLIAFCQHANYRYRVQVTGNRFLFTMWDKDISDNAPCARLKGYE